VRAELVSIEISSRSRNGFLSRCVVWDEHVAIVVCRCLRAHCLVAESAETWRHLRLVSVPNDVTDPSRGWISLLFTREKSDIFQAESYSACLSMLVGKFTKMCLMPGEGTTAGQLHLGVPCIVHSYVRAFTDTGH